MSLAVAWAGKLEGGSAGARAGATETGGDVPAGASRRHRQRLANTPTF